MRFVIKFGGSSLSTVSKVKKVAEFVSYFLKTKANELFIVVSAMGKTTDALLNLAKKANKNLPKEKLPELVCIGEKISANVLSLALENIGIDNVVLYPENIRMFCKGEKDCGVLTHIETQRILHTLSQKKVAIVPGFQAIDQSGNLCMLRRGGSDISATALASALNAKCVIYTNVKGYFSANPNQIKTAKQLENLNIQEAIELSSCGAKIMEQQSLEIAHACDTETEVLKSQTKNGTSLYNFPVQFSRTDALSFKNNLVLACSKNADFPQIIQNICEKQAQNIYFDHFLNKNAQFFHAVLDNISREDKSALKNLEKTTLKKCEMITIVGCGFTNHEKLKSYLYKTCQKLNIFTFIISISPTTIKIITKPNQALLLSKALHNDLIKRRKI